MQQDKVTTDTVTQEWMEACKAEPIRNKRSQYGGYYPNAPIGIIDIVDGKRVFTPLVVGEPVFPADISTKHMEL